MDTIVIDKPLVLEPVPWRDRVVLHKDMVLLIDGRRYAVPQSFESDGASVPQPFWEEVFSPFQPRVLYAATLHDWLYLSHVRTQEDADQLFLRLLLFCGVARIKARAAFLGVRTFGHHAYEQDDMDRERLKTISQILLKREGGDPERVVDAWGIDPLEWLEQE